MIDDPLDPASLPPPPPPPDVSPGPQEAGPGVPEPSFAGTQEHPDDAPAAPAAQAQVVAFDAHKARKRRADVSAGPSPPPPPAPPKREARSEGMGGEAEEPSQDPDPPAPGKSKREKKIDWGKYTYLVENFTFIYPTDTAWDHEKRKLVKFANMAHMYGADYVRMWKGSPDRKTVDEEDLVFDPTNTCSPDAINLWDGLAVLPVVCADAEVSVMLELLRHLCGRCDSGITSVDDVMDWVLKWLALPFQKHGAKMATALVFHGPQGTGKNLFFDVIRDMYGKYGVMVGQTEIEEKYNGWISAKQLVIGNEVVSRQELYHNKNRLKWMIDAEKIPIRTMHTDTRWETNHANLIFLSNEKQPLVLEIGDRRYLVVYTPVPEEAGLYDRVRAFLKTGGAAKFMHYLMSYPLGGFHEHTKPLMTEAKQDLIELSMKPEERFMIEWTGGYLHLPMHVCSAEQLYRAFRRWCDDAGEKYPPARSGFTTAARRWAIERVDRDEYGEKKEPCLTYKVSQLPNANPDIGRKALRCWIPRGTGPLNGVTEGQWVAEAVDAFELALSRFLRSREGSAETPVPDQGKKGSGQ